MPTRVQKSTSDCTVVDLDAVRERQRFGRFRDRVRDAVDVNRDAIDRLAASGLLYTRHGARVGRELLGARLELLRLNDALGRRERERAQDASAAALDALFVEIESLLEKASEIARRNRGLFTNHGP